MVWDEAGFAVVDQRREVPAISPVGGEVGDVFTGESSVYPSEESGVFLCQGLVAWRGALVLKVEFQLVYEAQNQLEVPVNNVRGICGKLVQYSWLVLSQHVRGLR